MSIIKKHPIAFLTLIGLVLMGLSGNFAVYDKVQQDWYSAMVGLMFIIGAVMIAVSCIAGIIASICKSKRKNNEIVNMAQKSVDELAYEYVTKSKFGAVYWIIIILLTPITPLLLIHLLDYFFFGVLLMMLGVMIWLVATQKDAFKNHFYNVKNAGKYFTMESGEDDKILNALYGDYAHVYRMENWDNLKDKFICSLLKHESKLGKNIKCYYISNSFLSKKYGYEYNKYLDKLIVVPFAQFDFDEKSGQKLRNYFDRLSITRYTDLVNYKYQEKKSTDPKDYAYTDENISLMPLTARLTNIEERDGDICISVTSACDKNDAWKKYYNCLMVLKNAEKTGDILVKGESHVESCKFDEEEKKLIITILTEPQEDSDDLTDEEFFDGIRTTVHCRYEKLQWYWDGFCDSTKTKEVFEKINTEAIK